MVDLNDQRLRRQNALDDITETTGLVFLGLTIGCARCHDHKFDPIQQTDFYQPPGLFRRVAVPRRLIRWRPGGSAHEYSRARAAWEHEVSEVQAGLDPPRGARARESLAPGNPPGLNDETAAAFAKPEAERTPTRGRAGFRRAQGATAASRRSIWKTLLDPATRVAAATSCSTQLDRVMRAAAAGAAQTRGDRRDRPGRSDRPICSRRGDFTARGPEIGAGSFRPCWRSRGVDGASRCAPSRSSGRRSALADWLARPDHPLTARVIVNRLWQQHFGRGLVATPSDFGTMGEEPSHPELLDWLATELVAEGWSLKAMHRLIVTSATYRQSSVADRRPLAGRSRELCSSADRTAGGSTARRSATRFWPSPGH